MEQRFDNNANIPTTQPDMQQEEATSSTHNIIKPIDIHHSGNKELQLDNSSNDDDEFYVGCMVDPGVTGVERVDDVPEAMSDFDKAVFFVRPMDPGGLFVNDPSLKQKSF